MDAKAPRPAGSASARYSDHSRPKVPKVRPGRDLGRPHRRGDQLRCNHQRVAAVLVANEVGKSRKRGSSLAGPKGRDKKGSVVFVEPGSGSFLVGAQNAMRERCVHLRAAFDFE